VADVLTKTIRVIIKAIDQTGGIVKSVAGGLGKLGDQAKKTGKDQDGLRKGTEKATDAVRKQGAQVKKGAGALRLFGSSSQKARREVTAMGTAAKSAGAGIGSLISKFTTAAATIGTIAFPIAKAAQFERAMATVGAVSGATGKDLDSLTMKAREMGEKTEFSATQAADGLRFLAMAGLNVEQQLAALEPALNLALAGNIELGQAADIATNIMTGFGASVSELPGMMDVLTQAFTNSNTNLTELGHAMAYVAPVAAGMGVEFNDLVSAMSALANAGLKGSIAGTALRGTLVKLFKPTAKSEKVMQSLAQRIGQTNIELRNAEGGFIGFAGLIDQFAAANVSAAEAMEIFGLRAGPAFIALLNQGSAEMRRFNKLMDEAGGRTAEIAKVMGNNFVGATKQLLSSLQELAINFGSAFLGDLKEATLSIRDLVISINTWVSANKTLVKNVGYAVAALGALSAAAGLLAVFKTLAVVALGPFTSALNLIKAKGLVAVAALATIAATWGELIYEMVKSNGDLEKSVENWDFAKWLNNLTLPFIESKKTIGDFATYAIAFWDKFFSKIGYGWALIPVAMKSAFSDGLDLIANFAQNILNTMKEVPGLGQLLGWSGDVDRIQQSIDGIRAAAQRLNTEAQNGYRAANKAYQQQIKYANDTQAGIERTAAAREREAQLIDYMGRRESAVAQLRANAQSEIREATKSVREEIEKQNRVLKGLYERVGQASERYKIFVDQAKSALESLGKATNKALSSIWENVTNDQAVADVERQLQQIQRQYETYSDQGAAAIRRAESSISKARIEATRNGVDESLALIEAQRTREIALLNETKEKEVAVAKATISDVATQRKRLEQIEKDSQRNIVAVNEKTLAQKKALYEKATTALKSELDKSLSAERSIADEIIAVQDKIRNSKKSTEELVRGLRRQGLSEERAYADEVAEVDEKIAAATKLMATDTKKSIQLLQEAQRQASGLVGEISSGEKILVSEQQTINEAISQVERAQSAIEAGAASYQQSLQGQLQAQKQNTDGIVKQLDAVGGKLQDTRDQMQQGIEISIRIELGDFEARLEDITRQREIVVGLETQFAEGKQELTALQKDLADTTEVVKIKYDAEIADAIRAMDEVERKKLGIAEIRDVIKIDADNQAAVVALNVLYEDGERVRKKLEQPMPISLETAKAIQAANDLDDTISPIMDELRRQEKLGIDVSEAKVAVVEFGDDIDGLTQKLSEMGVIRIEGATESFVAAAESAADLEERVNSLINVTDEHIVVDVSAAGQDDVQAIAGLVKQLQEDTEKELAIQFGEIEGFEQFKEVQERADKLKNAVAALNAETPDVEVEGGEELEQVAEDASTAADGVAELAAASGELEDVGVDVTVEGIDEAKEKFDGFVEDVATSEATVTVDVDDSGVDETTQKVLGLNELESQSAHIVNPEADKVLGVISQIRKPTSSTHTIYVKKVVQSAVGGFVDGISEYAKGGPVAKRFKKLTRPYIPGDGTEDDVPAMLMRGEYVVRKDAVKKYGIGLLNKINGMNIDVVPKFAKGGPVGMSAALNLIPTMASGAVTRLLGSGGVNFNSGTAQRISTPMGKNIANGLANLFTSSVQKLQGGGFLSRSRSLFEQQKQSITKQYAAQMQLARLNGEEQIAYLLEVEQEELQRMADELATALVQIQNEYEAAIAESDLAFDEERTDIERELSELQTDIENDREELTTSHSKEVNELQSRIGELRSDIKGNTLKSKQTTFSLPGAGRYTLRRNPAQQAAFDQIPKDKAEIEKLERQLTTSERAFQRKEEFYQNQLAKVRKEGTEDLEYIGKEKAVADKGAERDRDFGTEKAESTTLHAQNKLRIETKHQVAQVGFDTQKSVLEFEGNLRSELLDIERAMLEEEKQAAAERAAAAKTGGLKYFLAAGGAIPRKEKWIPGDGVTDSVPAMLMRGEYVVNKNAVKKFGVGFFDMLNAGALNFSKFASGGLVGMKRQLDLLFNSRAPYTNGDGMVMNLNNPTFIGSIRDRVSGLSEMGQRRSAGLLSAFNGGVTRLQEGGAIDQAQLDLAKEKELVTAQYQAQIEAARNVGAVDIAALLEEERYELELLANDLQFLLQELQSEYEYERALLAEELEAEKQEAEAALQQELSDIRAARAQAAIDYENAKQEAKRLKVQSGYDAAHAYRLPTRYPRPANKYAALSEFLSGGLTETERKVKDVEFRDKRNEARTEARNMRQEGIALERSAELEYKRAQQEGKRGKERAEKDKAKSERNAQRRYQIDLRRTDQTFQRETSKAEKEAETETVSIQNKSVINVEKAKVETQGEIAKLEADLALELFKLEKEYRDQNKANIGGVRHFLREGGSVGFPAGAKRGADSIKAMLTPGEFVMRPEAVKTFGLKFMDAVNRLKMPAIRFAEGGLVPGNGNLQSLAPAQAIGRDPEYAAKLVLELGGKEYPMRTKTDVGQDLVKQFRTLGLAVAR